MSKKDDCLFCKIVAGEVPSTKVYEDERVLAFEDVSPQMPVHGIPVQHREEGGRAQRRRRKRLPRDREHRRRRSAVGTSYPRPRLRRCPHELRQPVCIGKRRPIAMAIPYMPASKPISREALLARGAFSTGGAPLAEKEVVGSLGVLATE